MQKNILFFVYIATNSIISNGFRKDGSRTEPKDKKYARFKSYDRFFKIQ